MAVVAEELYSLLVPLGQDRLIVPRNCIAEVVRYTAAPIDEPHAPWLWGMTHWGNQNIPVISFETLCGDKAPEPSGRTRVVVFHPLAAAGCPPYGVLSEGFPQMVKLNREVVVLDESYHITDGAPLICQIIMLKERALIPDLAAVEQKIVAELAIHK